MLMFTLPEEYFEVKNTIKKGKGVFAKKKMLAGIVLGDYLGKVTKYEDVFYRDYPFLMFLDDTTGIVANKDDVGIQNINHSCDPNSTMYPHKAHTLFVATKSINEGEEITISYRFTPISECPDCKHECFCESKNCLGTMHSSKESYDNWQKYLQVKENGTEKDIQFADDFLLPLKVYPKDILISELFL